MQVMVFVITHSVRDDIVHFLLWQGRLKTGIPQKGPPPKPHRKCECTGHDHPTTSHQELPYASSLFVQRWRGGRRGAVLSEKLPLGNLGNGSRGSLSLHKFTLLGFCTWRISFYFWKSVVLAHACNSRTLSLCQPLEFSSQHQPVFCISSFQMALWHFNFKTGRLVSLN